MSGNAQLLWASLDIRIDRCEPVSNATALEHITAFLTAPEGALADHTTTASLTRLQAGLEQEIVNVKKRKKVKPETQQKEGWIISATDDSAVNPISRLDISDLPEGASNVTGDHTSVADQPKKKKKKVKKESNF
ncbi:hypothetical protein EMMF5_000175 [Cystobasidiomycetes sp. EMM_F5]